ncbi:hypothetical protein MVEG_00589 [Podila verticillata NRRL 6337]|nr:hypothetical protein MVEG_00589 [Podila verticillata NRRL 6337]
MMWIPSSTILRYSHYFQTVINHNTSNDHHARLLGSDKIQDLTIVKSDWSTRIMSSNVDTITRLHWAGSNVWAESKFEAWEYAILGKMRYLRELELMGWITLSEPDFCVLLTGARNLTKLKLRGVNGLNEVHRLSGQLMRLESLEIEMNEMNSAFMLGLISYLPNLSHLLIDATWAIRSKAHADLEVLVNHVGQFCKELQSIALSTSFRFESTSLAVRDDLIASLASCGASRGLRHFSADLDVVGPKLEMALVAQKATLASLAFRVSEIHNDGRQYSCVRDILRQCHTIKTLKLTGRRLAPRQRVALLNRRSLESRTYKLFSSKDLWACVGLEKLSFEHIHPSELMDAFDFRWLDRAHNQLAAAAPRVIDTSSGEFVRQSREAPVIPNQTSFELDLWRQLLALPKLTELQWNSVLHLR